MWKLNFIHLKTIFCISESFFSNIFDWFVWSPETQSREKQPSHSELLYPTWVATQSSARRKWAVGQSPSARTWCSGAQSITHRTFLTAKTTHFIFPAYTLRSTDFFFFSPRPSAQCLFVTPKYFEKAAWCSDPWSLRSQTLKNQT